MSVSDFMTVADFAEMTELLEVIEQLRQESTPPFPARESIDIVGWDLHEKYDGNLETFRTQLPPEDTESDDPPVPASMNYEREQNTVGVTMEFLMAICSKLIGDPGQLLDDEDRWLSQALADMTWEGLRPASNGRIDRFLLEAIRRTTNVATRDRILRTLRFKGLYTHTDRLYPGEKLEEAPLPDIVEGEEEHGRISDALWLAAFKTQPSDLGNAPDETTRDNIAAMMIQKDFWQAYHHYVLDYRRTKAVQIDLFLSQQTYIKEMPEGHRSAFQDRVRESIWRVIDKSIEVDLNYQKPDPDSVPMDGLDKHKSWTCTLAHLAQVPNNGNWYYYAPFLGRLIPDGHSATPFHSYLWFEGKLRSPVYPANDLVLYDRLLKATDVIRSQFRIHLPTPNNSTSVGVHFGSNHGWTLLQLKKFVTLWLVVEPFILMLCREDRHERDLFVHRLGPWSRVLEYVTSQSRDDDTKNLEWFIPRRFYMNKFQSLLEHFPLELVADEFHFGLMTIWQYESINALREGLKDAFDYKGERDIIWPVLRLNFDRMPKKSYSGFQLHVDGYKRSGDTDVPAYKKQKQTVEIRFLQGTLDAAHIWHWVKVLEGLVRFVRNSDSQEFLAAITQFVQGIRDTEDQQQLVREGNDEGIIPVHPFERLCDIIHEIPDQTRQFFMTQGKQWDPENDCVKPFWTYPDHNMVSYHRPFMVPGPHKVHGDVDTEHIRGDLADLVTKFRENRYFFGSRWPRFHM